MGRLAEADLYYGTLWSFYRVNESLFVELNLCHETHKPEPYPGI